MRRTLADLMQPTCLPQFTRAYREIQARDLALLASSELQGDENPLRGVLGKSARRSAGLTAAQLLRATKWLHENLSEDHDLRDLAAVVEATPERPLLADGRLPRRSAQLPHWESGTPGVRAH
jgi:hypothetical protein